MRYRSPIRYQQISHDQNCTTLIDLRIKYMFNHSLEHLKNIRYRNINCTPDFFVKLCGFTYMYTDMYHMIIIKGYPFTKSDITNK